ncbi:hypothetical protein B0J12DRAFT_292670 [Macrophomina phaseolina]|uniref:Uncharacterized protein n=1 Tax=Macrophomina phaseolina TaxID=35725 RepID=A0ABQ8GRE3_9PEZI|nr:hypothetical protein B0J12DRAFT_292670 [Macrophomina phaseolina]
MTPKSSYLGHRNRPEALIRLSPCPKDPSLWHATVPNMTTTRGCPLAKSTLCSIFNMPFFSCPFFFLSVFQLLTSAAPYALTDSHIPDSPPPLSSSYLQATVVCLTLRYLPEDLVRPAFAPGTGTLSTLRNGKSHHDPRATNAHPQRAGSPRQAASERFSLPFGSCSRAMLG